MGAFFGICAPVVWPGTLGRGARKRSGRGVSSEGVAVFAEIPNQVVMDAAALLTVLVGEGAYSTTCGG